ncbi:hypothetical protein [Actinopolyspora halophila]|uniref:hypothetical protein n=1 Tax=Actinopolyspora halophila TaxID=1850 RepID=UPI00036E00E0|nr:hypothetical protein [Actinopolyspora halophila]
MVATLLHELCHVADDCQSSHRGTFAERATRLGFNSPMTTTLSSVELAAEMMTLGEYPHGKLDTAQARSKNLSGPSKQGTRMMRLHCPHCGYTVRTTAKWLAYGNPRCPAGEEMTL